LATEVASTETDAARNAGAAISRATVQLYLGAFGRGPTKARTYIQADFAVCILRDVFTRAEQTLIASGGSAQVEAARKTVNDAIEDEFVAVVERESGRRVQTHVAQIRVPANLALHFFLFETAGSPAAD
jgi:uncharacterized protein YbcI